MKNFKTSISKLVMVVQKTLPKLGTIIRLLLLLSSSELTVLLTDRHLSVNLK